MNAVVAVDGPGAMYGALDLAQRITTTAITMVVIVCTGAREYILKDVSKHSLPNFCIFSPGMLLWHVCKNVFHVAIPPPYISPSHHKLSHPLPPTSYSSQDTDSTAILFEVAKQVHGTRVQPRFGYRAIKINLPWSPYRPGPPTEIQMGGEIS